jgi:hypothetical protein
LLIGAVAVLLIWLGASATVEAKIPLPPDMNIVEPDPSLPEEIRGVSDKWQGQWGPGSGVQSVFIIEKIDRDIANVIYGVDDYVGPPNIGAIEGKSTRGEAKVSLSDGVLTLNMVLGTTKFIFWYHHKEKPDILEGLRITSGGKSSITMKRVR